MQQTESIRGVFSRVGPAVWTGGWVFFGLLLPRLASSQAAPQSSALVNSPLEQTYLNSGSPLNPFQGFYTQQQFFFTGRELSLIFPSLRPTPVAPPPLLMPRVPSGLVPGGANTDGAALLSPTGIGLSPFSDSFYPGMDQGPIVVPGQSPTLPGAFPPQGVSPRSLSPIEGPASPRSSLQTLPNPF